MLKNIAWFFLYKTPEFIFSQNNVFSHACSTPLTILMSNLEADVCGSNQTSENRAKTSLEAVNKLYKIIQSVNQSDEFNEKFRVSTAINEVLCLMRGKIDYKCFESKLLINNDLFLIGNKLYFQEALTCIFNNSIEAYKDIEQKPVSFIVRKVNDQLRIDEIDYGSGMNFIFQKLVIIKGMTTKKNGMGLGLHFAKKTVENIFSGKMMIRSTVGLGTHITWIIPLQKPCSQNLLPS
ncbi:MAG: hypothetical protein COZ34_02590 [Candidatus Pacebacteria bacterium CG_4_10_14_3_um_filter_34_15]|nr:HAMP domain-containing histidine kinase [Candidatus Pacearchaeota archaeon]NCQ65636.1 HAMP domain-containing histidine kinase [Candidatus Paceibacterota bacterium]PIQ81318.1 MAG: hypothetical protein COV78_00865 [Candidatus Pacebacteria bacterium CG11_big_fil_rev_8_21_14_0_20_34_55]PIX81606.1 MAG: hypothetical protein COZ34_02590 [Candidatus Pacebacteria bacterium CG_4_10_14_3_um_filter_34_15]PJC44210.1 MAG: hypothetical protein CO039_00015 [Candidatus Pacebacteria bacterium CG_4_9_14_0_2_um